MSASSVDFFSATFDHETMSAAVLDEVREIFHIEEQKKGFFGFLYSYAITHHGAPVGVFAFGGSSQNGRAMLSFSGLAFGVAYDDCLLLCRTISQLPGTKITRVDLAVDLFEGEVTIEQAVEAYKDGRFQVDAQGNRPSSQVVGDWITEGSPDGRTFYVGKRENGKQTRFYEKGKQLGDKRQINWNRCEVELRGKDRLISADVLLDPDRYFAGASIFCAEVMRIKAGSANPERCTTVPRLEQAGLSELLGHVRNSYGQLLGALREHYEVDLGDVFALCARDGMPNRLRGLVNEKTGDMPFYYRDAA